MASPTSTTCKLCYEKFSLKRPERIPRKCYCEHTFCTECLQKLQNLQGFAIECPQCLSVTTIPSKGVDYMPKNYTVLGIEEGSKVYDHCKHCRKYTYPPKSATLHCTNCDDTFCGPCSDKKHLKIENQDHVIRLANSFDDLKLIHARKSASQRSSSLVPNDAKMLSGRISDFQLHDEAQPNVRPESKLSFSNEEAERRMLADLKSQFDDSIEYYCNVHSNVFHTIEELKQNVKTTKENIRRSFRDLHNILDETEINVTQDIQQICDRKLTTLKNQYSSMSELSRKAKTISYKCQEALQCDYYDMFVQKKQLEEEIYKKFQELKSVKLKENSDVYVQFPNHETIINSLQMCAFIVRAPSPPYNLKCTLTPKGDVSLSWEMKIEKFTYQPTLYSVYASVGIDSSFVLLKKLKCKQCILERNHDLLRGLHIVQFQVTAINLIGESAPCWPVSTRMVKLRITTED